MSDETPITEPDDAGQQGETVSVDSLITAPGAQSDEPATADASGLVGIVEALVFASPDPITLKQLCKVLDTELAYELPDDPEIPSSVNRALPIVLADASSPFSRALGELLPSIAPAPHAAAPSQHRSRRFLMRGRR